MDRHRLTIVIPAHNEARTIAAVVRGAVPFGRVLVVDDNSSDQTAGLAREAGADVLSNAASLRYDGSLGRGVDAAFADGAEAVVTMDADGEHDPALLADFRRLLVDEGVPLVLGYRPRTQRLAEALVALYSRARWGVKDLLCGMKGFHRELYERNGGFDHVQGVNMELAVMALTRGTPFRQILVTGTPRQDAPRFGRVVRANISILAAAWRVSVR